jgi:cytochrome P450
MSTAARVSLSFSESLIVKTARETDVRRLVAEKQHDSWVEMSLRYGKTFRLSNCVITCEPEIARALLMDKVHTEVRSKLHKIAALIPGANGVLFMDGDAWLKRIRALMPVFHREHVDTFRTSLRDLTLQYARDWQKQGRVPDLAGAIQQLGAASVLRMGYGLDPEHPLARELARALVDYKQTTMNPDSRYRLDEFAIGNEKLLELPWIAGSTYRIWRKTIGVRQAVRALVADKQAILKQHGWFSDLYEAGFSEKDFVNEINHLYGAFNAIDYVVTTALYELARDSQLAMAMRRELNSAFGDQTIPSREDLPRLPLTRGFLLEILRLYPVSMTIARRLGAPMKLGDEEFPAGTEVGILPYALHYHPDFWTEPNRLLPERWAHSDEPRVPYSYIPFLDGLRKCIGRSMAEMQLLVVLTTIVRNFDVGVFADAVIPPFIIPRFAKPVPFVVQTPLAQ